MDERTASGNKAQNGMRDARTHVNRQKGRDGIEPPRTVAEQLDELVEIDDATGERRRDPVGAADAQRTQRDNGVGGAWIDTAQRANAASSETYFEKVENPDRTRERHGDSDE